ncbi:MAG: hypothetical protein ACI9QL_001422 [Candidatus Omnitrophota bacterium]|jgi:hypothetical protein
MKHLINKKFRLMFGLLLSSASFAYASLITPTGVTASSALTGLSRPATTTIDGSGVTGGGGADTHGNSVSATMWTSNGTLGNLGTPAVNDLDPEITFDLGGLYDVNTVRVWNYNENTFTRFGANSVEIFAGETLGTLASAGTFVFIEADSSTTTPAQDIVVPLNMVQFIRFDVLTNHDGAIFDGTGANGGIDGRSLTGLSEVRFDGTASIPEPSTAALFCFGIALILRLCCRRK